MGHLDGQKKESLVSYHDLPTIETANLAFASESQAADEDSGRLPRDPRAPSAKTRA
jgi:hypothetical protein